MKELKTYAHLYLGCDVKKQYDDGPELSGKLVGVTTSEVEPWETLAIVNLYDDIPFQEFYVEEVKLVLRPLSDMTSTWDNELQDYTDKENDEWFQACKYGLGGSSTKELWLDQFEQFEERPAMKKGKVLVKKGLKLEHYCFAPQCFTYLLSRSFDLFGLIDLGLAVSKTETKN